MLARTVMVQGTASSVGKSILATALCRFYARRGLRVAPFKAQNMALNAFVTPDGGEIGRAQAVQAQAARVIPTVDMNPILLKPEGDSRAQVIVLGKVLGSLNAAEYQAAKPELRDIVAGALQRLREVHDVVVIEGAGSPAEINLKERDLVNMYVARVADAPVLLVGDIDRGGVFAAFVGTMELLEPDERARVKAFVVNKFRGDVRLLEPGLRFLEDRTKIPVLGVVPWVDRLRVADEDSVSLEDRRRRRRAKENELDVAVVRLPRISNHDDFAPLEHEPGVVVRFVDAVEEIEGADLVVLPGTKSTIPDLAWLRASGLADAIVRRAAAGGLTLGICGGCQMLGEAIEDPEGIESSQHRTAEGLGLLRVRTRFERTKTAAQVRAVRKSASFLGPPGPGKGRDGDVTGYEIHMGVLERTGDEPAFEIQARHGKAVQALDGAVDPRGLVVGTMIHGLFDADPFRYRLLRTLRERKGLPPVAFAPRGGDEYDRLADVLEASIDVDLLDRIVGS